MIEIDRVSHRFGSTRAVRDVSLSIAAGQSLALWGANGAGKTTLLRCVLGLLRFQGRITIAGHDVLADGKRARSLIGYVPQEIGFYDDLRAGEAIAYFARLKGAAARPGRLLEGVGIADAAPRRIRELSGGMKQRLALAIAMLGDPAVLVLDEVTASLDACGRREFITMLRQLTGAGRTLLFASHRIDEVTLLAERVAVLDRGRVIATHKAGELAHALGATAVLHLTLRNGTKERAMDMLTRAGFKPSSNGTGLLVPVPDSQKAAPMRLLAEAGVAVEDFDVLSGSGFNEPTEAQP